MKGILFRAANIEAIRSGRKTMTRRVIAPQPKPGREPGEWMRPCGRSTWDTNTRMTVITTATGTTSEISHVPPEQWLAQFAKHKPGEVLYVKRRLMQPAREAELLIRIEAVRVERVQQITPEDVEREGFWRGRARRSLFYSCPGACYFQQGQPYDQLFSSVWDQINGAGSWAANPWVWVYQFKVETQQAPVDGIVP